MRLDEVGLQRRLCCRTRIDMGRIKRARSAAAREEAEARFSRLYEENWEDLLQYALRRAATPEDAADLVAETFLVAWRRLDLVPPGARTRLWLFGVARRLLANQRRGEFRRDRLAERLRGELAVVPREPSPESGGSVTRVLGRLEKGDREILLLAGCEELEPAEIAKVLDISAVAARSRLHRARRRFMRELEADESCGPRPGPELTLEEAR
jgi:RNA polymerase sigma factor (sigma-70 family)